MVNTRLITAGPTDAPWNAVSAFANCGHAVTHVRGSYVPEALHRPPEPSTALDYDSPDTGLPPMPCHQGWRRMLSFPS